MKIYYKEILTIVNKKKVWIIILTNFQKFWSPNDMYFLKVSETKIF